MANSQLEAWRSPHDRVSFKELRAHYDEPLKKLSRTLESVFTAHPTTDPQVHDDIFILRYLLSKKGDVAAAEASIHQALAWRKENLSLIKAATDLTKPPSISQENLQMLNCYMAAGVHTPTSYGDLVLIIRAACNNFNELVKDLESVATYMMFLWEVCYQYCDKESRNRGYFVKLYVVNDMNGFSPSPFVMKKFAAVMGNQSKRSEFLYPQFLAMMCAVNAPSVINFIFKMISPLMSKGFVDKFHIHGALTPDPSRIAAKDLPLPFKGDDAARMPSFLGGKCECKGGCVGFNVPNVLPPPPKKTPADLPSAALFTTFVQVRYLQKQREEATKEVNTENAAVDQSTTRYPVLLSSKDGECDPSNTRKKGGVISADTGCEQEKQPDDKIWGMAGKPFALHTSDVLGPGAIDCQTNKHENNSIILQESSIQEDSESPLEPTDIQIETKSVHHPCKGFFGCW